MPDGTFQAVHVLTDDKGQEVSFSGYGDTREHAYKELDKALATGMKAFPGLRSREADVSGYEYVRDAWNYRESRRPKSFCTTVIEFADGTVSRRDDMDWNDRDSRRAFLAQVRAAMETGGRVQMVSDKTIEVQL